MIFGHMAAAQQNGCHVFAQTAIFLTLCQYMYHTMFLTLCQQSGRRQAISSPADLPHHRAYRSVHGGSSVYVLTEL